MWGWVAIAFASAGAALSAAELLSREQPRAAAPPGPQRLRKVRWHLGNSKASLALAFVFAGSLAIVAGKTLDQANKDGWGVGWVASDDRHGRACGPVLTIVRPQSAAAVPCVRVRVAGTRKRVRVPVSCRAVPFLRRRAACSRLGLGLGLGLG